MRRLLIAAILFIGAAGAATAAEAAIDHGPSIMTPTHTVGECLTIYEGLKGLDGHIVLIHEGKPDESTFIKSYQFDNAELRSAIASDLAALDNVKTIHDRVKQSIFKEIVGEGYQIKQDTKEMVLYQKRVYESEQLPCEAVLTRIRLKDLKLDKNEIPGTILAALDKILDK